MAVVDRPIAKPRPVYLNLAEIRQPLPAVVSILHRISGAVLFFVGIPVLLWGLDASLGSPDAYAQLRAIATSPIGKIVLLVLAWAYLHHLLAGLRHLLMDARIGASLQPARRSAAAVMMVALFCTLLVVIRLW